VSIRAQDDEDQITRNWARSLVNITWVVNTRFVHIYMPAGYDTVHGAKI